MNLSVSDFSNFFREVHGHDPFPWQDRLLRRVASEGIWPEIVDLPTGCGKTSVLDVALFHLALEANSPQRTAPLRIAFIVDRRLIVDQTKIRAEKIQNALEAPGNRPVVAAVANSLGKFSEQPLNVAVLRGGIPRENFWARTPTQPTVLLSTVDQVGSRLLFRGYGVSDKAKPIHAGLLGQDCLLFLDEAHLSEAFRQTAKAIGAKLVTLSATPTSAGSRFSLEADDESNAVLNRRLSASKPAELLEGGSFVDEAIQFSTSGSVLVVVNRVNLARQVFGELKERAADKRIFLLTGRVRDLDRQKLLSEIEPLVHAGRGNTTQPVIVVATQAIEAGADFDFDALVTQIAPIDSLKQRFGRLNRFGDRPHSRAKIIAQKEDLKSRRPDPIYGDRLVASWNFLTKVNSLNFGVRFLPTASQAESTEPRNAPVLLPPYLDFWAQTSPLPPIEPHLGLFLHGNEKASADVNLVWRSDLGEFTEDDVSRIARLLNIMPPRSGETLAVPVYAVRAWLENFEGEVQVADIEGVHVSLSSEKNQRLRVLRWSDELTEFTWPNSIRPGDTIVLPSSFGGCDAFGWNPASRASVIDLADEASEVYAAKEFFVRLHPVLFDDPETSRQAIRLSEELRENLPQLIAELLGLENLPSQIASRLQRLSLSDRLELHAYCDESESDHSGGVILFAPLGARGIVQAESLMDSDAEASFRRYPQTLREHTSHVVRKTCEFSSQLHLVESRDLEIAAELHDLGKGDRRFQALLRGGSVIQSGEPLAKSDRRRVDDQVLKRSINLPERWRHEALSVRLALQHRLLLEANDPMLVLWLIGTHHGYGRPFFPHQDPLDSKDRFVSAVDSTETKLVAGFGPQQLAFDYCGHDWCSLFQCLRERYGVWRLAYLEAILRLADQRASEEGDRRA